MVNGNTDLRVQVREINDREQMPPVMRDLVRKVDANFQHFLINEINIWDNGFGKQYHPFQATTAVLQCIHASITLKMEMVYKIVKDNPQSLGGKKAADALILSMLKENRKGLDAVIARLEAEGVIIKP